MAVKTRSEVNWILEDFSKQSKRSWGTYAHAAGFFQGIVANLVSEMTEGEQDKFFKDFEQWKVS